MSAPEFVRMTYDRWVDLLDRADDAKHLEVEVERLRDGIETIASKLSVARRPEVLEALVNELLGLAHRNQEHAS
jgi:hypothetical protein